MLDYYYVNEVASLEATAIRRLKIIKEMYGFLRQCPYCGVYWGNFKNHADDCVLAAELADD